MMERLRQCVQECWVRWLGSMFIFNPNLGGFFRGLKLVRIMLET